MALLGVFGDSKKEVNFVKDPIKILINYPSRIRYKQRKTLDLSIENISKASLQNIKVIFNKEYINSFSDVNATPAFTKAYEVELGNLSPDEVAVIGVEYQADKAGEHTAKIQIMFKGYDPVTVELKSISFP